MQKENKVLGFLTEQKNIKVTFDFIDNFPKNKESVSLLVNWFMVDEMEVELKNKFNKEVKIIIDENIKRVIQNGCDSYIKIGDDIFFANSKISYIN